MSPSRARARIIPRGPNPSPLGGIARMPAKKSPDPFGEVRAQTLRHRAQHGCGAYPFADGSILGVIAAAVAAKRVLELGCALGYTALWFAHGAKGATIDTSSNLHFRDAETRAYRHLLFAGDAWLTAAIADGDTAMSVRLSRHGLHGCFRGCGRSSYSPSGRKHDVDPGRPASALRSGGAYLRAAVLVGLSAQQFAQDRRGQAAGNRPAGAELAAAGGPD